MEIIIKQIENGDCSGQRYPRTVLNPVWCRGNNLLIHEKAIINNADDSGPPGPLTFINWNSNLLKFPVSRILISEAANQFTMLSCVKKSNDEVMSSSEVINNSRKYRSIIASALESINPNMGQEAASWQKMFHEIAVCWHLCEILFLDLHPPGMLASQLLLWLRRNFSENNARAERVYASPCPPDDPLYWPVIKSFILKGDIENAKTLLDLYSKSESKEYARLLGELLRKMPIYTKGKLSHEFDMAWETWHDECVEIHKQGIFAKFPDMDDILAILCGNEVMIDEILKSPILRDTCEWFHLLPPILLFKDPCLKATSLGSLALECFSSFHGDSQGSNFDKVIVSAFNYNLVETIKYSCLFADNWWFASHFVDLLYQANQLSAHDIEDYDRLREFLLLDYADTLMVDESLWTAAIDYYDSCPGTGKERLELSLERIPITTEAVASKIYDIALKRNRHHLCFSICRTMAQSWLNKNRLSPALVWSIKTRDSPLISHIALEMMRQFIENEETHFADSEVISNLGTRIVICENLAFLAKYCEFETLKHLGHKIDAGNLLVSLIASNVSPDFFTPHLILQAKSFLIDEHLNPDQVTEVLTALDDFLISHSQDSHADDELTIKGVKRLRENECKLRLLCSNALAKGFLRPT